jgi:hypothetical protein
MKKRMQDPRPPCPHCGHRFRYEDRVKRGDGTCSCPMCGLKVVACNDLRTKVWTWDKRVDLRG